jgi:hypothetical protein
MSPVELPPDLYDAYALARQAARDAAALDYFLSTPVLTKRCPALHARAIAEAANRIHAAAQQKDAIRRAGLLFRFGPCSVGGRMFVSAHWAALNVAEVLADRVFAEVHPRAFRKAVNGGDVRLTERAVRRKLAALKQAYRAHPEPEINDLTALVDSELARVVNAQPAGEQTSPAGRGDTPNKTVSAALATLRGKKGGQGMVGKEIIAALKKKHINISAPYFRRHIVPELKKHGVRNHRSRGGYYIDPAER